MEYKPTYVPKTFFELTAAEKIGFLFGKRYRKLNPDGGFTKVVISILENYQSDVTINQDLLDRLKKK